MFVDSHVSNNFHQLLPWVDPWSRLSLSQVGNPSEPLLLPRCVAIVVGTIFEVFVHEQLGPCTGAWHLLQGCFMVDILFFTSLKKLYDLMHLDAMSHLCTSHCIHSVTILGSSSPAVSAGLVAPFSRRRSEGPGRCVQSQRSRRSAETEVLARRWRRFGAADPQSCTSAFHTRCCPPHHESHRKITSPEKI